MTSATTIDKLIFNCVLTELAGARKKHSPMRSAHEAYAVILEELDEFWEEVRQKRGNKVGMQNELIQVAAMAFRALSDLDLMGNCD